MSNENTKPCDAVCEIYSRVTGYHRPLRNWNGGKQTEFAERKLFKVNPDTVEVKDEEPK